MTYLTDWRKVMAVGFGCVGLFLFGITAKKFVLIEKYAYEKKMKENELSEIVRKERVGSAEIKENNYNESYFNFNKNKEFVRKFTVEN